LFIVIAACVLFNHWMHVTTFMCSILNKPLILLLLILQLLLLKAGY